MSGLQDQPRAAGGDEAGHAADPLTADLVERETELAIIDDVVEGLLAGFGRSVVIDGPAGKGKSRLLEAAMQRAGAAGVTVLRAQAIELEAEFPFAVAVQLFEPSWIAADDVRRARLSAGSARLAGELLDGRLTAAEPDAVAPPFALIHGLFALLRNLIASGDRRAAPGVMIVVDDAHWADSHSMRFLAYLAERLTTLPVAVLVSARTGDPGHEPRALAALRNAAGAAVMHLKSLSDAGVAEVARDRLPHATGAFVSACARLTGGNPFLLAALLEEVRRRGLVPDGRTALHLPELHLEPVAAAVTRRMAALPSACREVMHALAVLGDGALVARVAELAGLGVLDASRAADTLAHHHLVAPGAPLRFVHPLVGSAIRATMAPLQRAHAHRCAARMLLEQNAPAERVAEQLLHAPPEGDPAALKVLATAARQAMASGSPALAAQLFARARAEDPSSPSTAELLGEQALAEAAARMPEAAARLHEAIAVAATDRRRAELRLRLVDAYLDAGRLHEAAQVVADSPPRAPDAVDLPLLATARLVPALRERALAHATELLGLVGPAPTPDQRRGFAQAAISAALDHRPRELVLDLAARAVDPDMPLTGALAQSWRLVPAALHCVDALEQSVRLCDAAAGARAERDDELHATARALRAWPLFEQGRIDLALADARRPLDWLASAPGAGPDPRSQYAVLALCLIDSGELEQAETALSILDHPGARDEWADPRLLDARARLRLAQLRPAEALEDAQAAGRACAQLGADHPGLAPWRTTAALALIALGEHAQARALASAELQTAQAIGVGRAIARATRCVGLASRGAEREARLAEAVAVCDALPPRREQIECLFAFGAALRRGNQRVAARTPLARALDLARAGGAGELAASAQAELSATGARATRRLGGPTGALTPRELSVARLAASGQTTRVMAESLFVTPKTIEYHLRQIYRKLGISSRGELPDALSAHEG